MATNGPDAVGTDLKAMSLTPTVTFGTDAESTSVRATESATGTDVTLMALAPDVTTLDAGRKKSKAGRETVDPFDTIGCIGGTVAKAAPAFKSAEI
ncbi:MAG: hypothetical protein RLN85_20795, partial [Pseudomonadales bacterium]